MASAPYYLDDSYAPDFRWAWLLDKTGLIYINGQLMGNAAGVDKRFYGDYGVRIDENDLVIHKGVPLPYTIVPCTRDDQGFPPPDVFGCPTDLQPDNPNRVVRKREQVTGGSVAYDHGSNVPGAKGPNDTNYTGLLVGAGVAAAIFVLGFI